MALCFSVILTSNGTTAMFHVDIFQVKNSEFQIIHSASITQLTQRVHVKAY